MGPAAITTFASTETAQDQLEIPGYGAYRISIWTAGGKRLIDLAVSCVALIVLVPALLVLGIAVRLDSRGPALFRQRRAGRNGRPFWMYKLRTMSVDAEARIGEVIDLEELPVPLFNPPADPRVTRLGAWLRRWSLDELPQLFNVLRGDMTLVGPRPEQIDLVSRYRPEHRFRWALKPGLRDRCRWAVARSSSSRRGCGSNASTSSISRCVATSRCSSRRP